MTIRRTIASAVLYCAATALPGLLAAQAVPNQAERYLLASDVADGRALWTNPAGLVRRQEASLGAFATVEDSTPGLRLAQAGLQLSSRGFAFGWQRDEFGGGRSGNTYVLGMAFGGPRLGLGGTRRWYRRSAGNDGAWDLAAHLSALPMVDLDAVWRDIGSPGVGDSILEETLVVGAGLALPLRLRLSGEWHGATSGWVGRRTRVGLALYAGRGLSFNAVADYSDNPLQRSVAVAVHLGGTKGRISAFARDAGGASTQQAGVSAISVAPPPGRGGIRRR